MIWKLSMKKMTIWCFTNQNEFFLIQIVFEMFDNHQWWDFCIITIKIYQLLVILSELDCCTDWTRRQMDL